MNRNPISRKNDDKDTGKLDLPLFLGAIIILAVISIPIILFPDEAMVIVEGINNFITTNLGNWYIWFAFFTLIFCGYVVFSKYGKIKMGDPETKPEYNTFSWAAMLFCGGIGGTVIYWGFIEWVYYFTDPPLHYETGTWAAAELSAALGPYHWGFLAWTIYIIGGCACGYIIHVKKCSVFRISEACRGFFGDKVDGILGKVIDIGFIFGLIAGSATAFGLGTPLITALIHELTGIPDNNVLKIGTLLGITCIFAFTSFRGLEKGMKRISDANVSLTICVLIAIAIFGGGLVFTLDMSTTALGIIFQNFIQLNSWMDPGNVTNSYPETWSVYYWAYATVFAPFYGLFFAKISKGRTMREMILGTVTFGSAGCFAVFMVLSSFGIHLHMNGTLDLVSSLDSLGAPATIIEIIKNLPVSRLFMALLLIIIVLFVATTYDATSGVLASVSQTRLDKNGESKPWLRLLWAFFLVALPSGFIIGGSPLRAIQTITVIFALPCSVICIILAWSYVKMVKQDTADKKYSIESGVYNEKGLLTEDKPDA